MTNLPGKDPTEILNYSVEWAPELGTDTIVAHSYTIVGATVDAEVLSGTVQTFIVSGGTPGVTIKLAAFVDTAAGLRLRKLLVLPYAEPVSLEQAKAQCRIELDDADEDELIAGYISAARAWVEDATGHVLVRRPMSRSFETFGARRHACDWPASVHRRAPHLELYATPIVSVESVRYVDPDEVEQTYADPIVRLGQVPARIYPAKGGAWPAISCHGGVTVSFTAGYDETEVPDPLRQAMLLTIAHWYRNRESVVAGDRAAAVEVPQAAVALCDPYRLVRV